MLGIFSYYFFDFFLNFSQVAEQNSIKALKSTEMHAINETSVIPRYIGIANQSIGT